MYGPQKWAEQQQKKRLRKSGVTRSGDLMRCGDQARGGERGRSIPRYDWRKFEDFSGKRSCTGRRNRLSSNKRSSWAMPRRRGPALAQRGCLLNRTGIARGVLEKGASLPWRCRIKRRAGPALRQKARCSSFLVNHALSVSTAVAGPNR